MLSRILKFLIFSLCSLGTFASSPSLDDLIVKSDKLLVDKAKNIARFSGEVVLWFDDSVLKTNELVVYVKDHDDRREIEKIIIPKKLKASKNSTLETIVADSAEYSAADNALVFKGNIYMKKDEHLVKCDELIYFTQIKRISTKNKNDKKNQ